MMDEELLPELTLEERLAFAKARYMYAVKIYEQEIKRRDSIDTKAQFHLSFLTLFLGAIFLQFGFLDTLSQILKQPSTPVISIGIVRALIPIIGIVLTVSLFAILRVFAARKYLQPVYKNTALSLYGESPPEENEIYFDDEVSFIEETGILYSIAFDENFSRNELKARWLAVASFSTTLAVLLFAVLLAVIVYLLLYV